MAPSISTDKVNNKKSKESGYGLFLKNIELHRIYLNKAKYELFVLDEIPVGKFIKLQFNSSPEYKMEGKRKLIVSHSFQIVGKVEGLEEKLFEIKAIFILEYFVKKVPSEEIMEQFLKRHHEMHVWPYMREFIQNATRRMEIIPPLVLPLSRLPKQEATKKT